MRTIITWALIGFAVWYLVTNPAGAAAWVTGAAHVLESAARSLSSFVSNL